LLTSFRYGGTITNQIKRLGASCDWSREHFTLDEQLSRKTIFYLLKLSLRKVCKHILENLWSLNIQIWTVGPNFNFLITAFI